MDDQGLLDSILQHQDLGPLLFTYLPRRTQGLLGQVCRLSQEKFRDYQTRYSEDYRAQRCPLLTNAKLTNEQFQQILSIYNFAKAEWGKDRWKATSLLAGRRWSTEISIRLMFGGTCALLCLATATVVLTVSAIGMDAIKGWREGPLVSPLPSFFYVRKLLHPMVFSRATSYYFRGLISAYILGAFGQFIIYDFLCKQVQSRMLPLPPRGENLLTPEELAICPSLDRWGRQGLISKNLYVKAKLEQKLNEWVKPAG